MISGLYEIEEIASGGICSIITNFYGLMLFALCAAYIIIWASIYPVYKSTFVKYTLRKTPNALICEFLIVFGIFTHYLFLFLLFVLMVCF